MGPAPLSPRGAGGPAVLKHQRRLPGWGPPLRIRATRPGGPAPASYQLLVALAASEWLEVQLAPQFELLVPPA